MEKCVVRDCPREDALLGVVLEKNVLRGIVVEKNVLREIVLRKNDSWVIVWRKMSCEGLSNLIHFQTQSDELISCHGKQRNGPGKSMNTRGPLGRG